MMIDRLKFFACSFSFAVCLSTVGATVFHRETAGAIWQDGLFLGDGATGVMAYAPGHLEWLVNRHDVVDARVFDMKYTPHDEVMACVRTNAGHSVAFLDGAERRSIKGPADGDRLTVSMSAAILRVRFWGGVGWSMPSLPETDQSLDVQTGEMTETMRSPSLCPQAVSLVERSRDVLAVKVSDPKDPDRIVVVEFGRPDDHRLDLLPFAWKEDGDVVSFEQVLPGGGSFAVALAVRGEVRFLGQNVCVRTRMSELSELFLAVRTSRDGADPRLEAVRAVRSAAAEGFARVREDNRRWWADFWRDGGRATFASDEAIDTRWHYALYALAAQFGRAPMPALNGLTYGPLGGGNPGNGSNCYVHDQNVQIPMLPFFPLNRARFVRPFLETYAAGMAEIRRHTHELFGVDGACLPLNMNPFGFENPTSSYRYTLCGSAYSGLVLAQAWRYSRDEALLREMYPVLREFVRFYVATGSYDEKGGWHTLWSVPPEIFTGSRDDTATVACLKPCLETAVEAATRFGCDTAECAEWKRILAHYPKIAVHPDGGWWCGPDVPTDHYMYGGHLFYPFFPAECDLDRERAERTLRYARDYAIEMSYETDEPHPVHEWSAFYQDMAKLRLHGGMAGWETMKEFDAAFAKPNGLFSHNPIIVTDLTPERIAANLARAPKLMRRDPFGNVIEWPRRGPDDLTYSASSKALVPPVLEGAAAFLLLATETLLQSWDGEIRLFPAVPKDFTGSFEGFRAKGGAVVSAAMEKGRLVSCRVCSSTVPVVSAFGARLKLTGAPGCWEYRANRMTGTAPRPAKVKVACIGDSITWGYAMTNRLEECYPSQLQRILGDRFDVRNFGDPGSGVYQEPRRAPDGWLSHPWRTGQSGRAAYSFEPDVVVCNLGINDVGAYMYEYENDEHGVPQVETGLFVRQYVDLLMAFRRNGRCPRLIIWSKLGPIGKRHKMKGAAGAFVMARDLEVVARRAGAETLDMYTPLVPYAETADFAEDGVHPEGGAQRVIAEVTARKILGTP